MRWEKVKLGDVSDSCLGKMLDQEKNKGEFHPYLANINVRWGNFDLDDLPQMRFEDDEQERYGLEYGDLVICEGGEPGRCAIWKNELPNMKIQKALHRVRTHKCLDYRYLYYWFLWAGKRGALEQYFTGATIKHMPGQKLKSILIDKPPIETQRCIADILSAYDDLIENNRKQIKLLEEAAQRLYKEWFVDLRFPGREHTRIVDGIPEGWEKRKLSDVFGYVRGKSYSSKDLAETGPVLMVNLKNIRSFGGYNRNAEKYYVGEFKGSQLLSAGDIVMGVTDMTQERRLVGHVAIIPRLHKSTIFSMDLIKLESKSIQKYFLYSALQYGGLSRQIALLANGVNVLHLKPDAMSSLEMIIPDNSLMEQYHQIFGDLYEQIETLSEQCDLATQARDRLLPKLMGGDVEA